MSNQDTQYLIRKVSTCQDCGGKGFRQDPHCSACGRYFTDDEMAALPRSTCLPCGHAILALCEQDWCVECEGEGKIEEWIDLPVALQELGILQILRDTVLILQNQETLNRMVHLKTRLETLNQNLAEALDAARA